MWVMGDIQNASGEPLAFQVSRFVSIVTQFITGNRLALATLQGSVG